MAIEKHFIDENVKKLIIRKFTEEELSKVGCGEVDIYRTPLGMRISIHAEKPGLIIGRKGKTIQNLTNIFVKDFKLENPQLEVQQIEVPELNASLMAQKIASALERGIHFRRAVYATMKRIMDSGALGCEVTVSGKVTGERARMSKFKDGFIKHAGEKKNEYIQEGYAQALLKPGVLGIKVTIVPPDANLKEITYISEEQQTLEPIEAEGEKAAPETKEEKSEEKKEGEKPGEKKPEGSEKEKEERPKKEKSRKAETSEKKEKKKTTEKKTKKTKSTKKRTPKKKEEPRKEEKTEEAKTEEVKDADTQN